MVADPEGPGVEPGSVGVLGAVGLPGAVEAGPEGVDDAGGVPDGRVDGTLDGGLDGTVEGAREGTVTVGSTIPGAGEVVGGNSVGGGTPARRMELVPGTASVGCGHVQPISSHPAGRVRKFVVMKTLR